MLLLDTLSHGLTGGTILTVIQTGSGDPTGGGEPTQKPTTIPMLMCHIGNLGGDGGGTGFTADIGTGGHHTSLTAHSLELGERLHDSNRAIAQATSAPRPSLIPVSDSHNVDFADIASPSTRRLQRNHT